MGPYTASSCCCEVQSLSWVPVRPPIAAASTATLRHVPLSSAHAADGFRFLTEACVWLPNTAASTATLRHVPLSSAHAAARSILIHGPLYRLLMNVVQRVCIT
ncbi:unnamed protein product [Staurois parvus]|uniref:Uncharacterized protein n=1 Tax=Staurois parvus TaxID=386267 RepID=A0ABN9B1D2_9NEOB|nr:unnamed protein product [Staurois parvus]